jgi:hypothetical protein
MGRLGKPTELFAQSAADKEGLVSVNDSATDAAEIIQELEQLEPPVVAGKLMYDPIGLDAPVILHLI